MTLTTTLADIVVQTISGLIINAPWFILFYLGFKTISKAIKEGSNNIIKNIPAWIEKYNNIIKEKRTIDNAIYRLRGT